MKNKDQSFLSQFKNFFVPLPGKPVHVTNNSILQELLLCFDNSCHHESVGSSLLFNTHFIIVLHPDVYESRVASLPVIVKEAVKIFYRRLSVLKKNYEDVTPVSSAWHFRFGPGTEFNHENLGLHDIKVIGMLTGLKETSGNEEQPGSATTKVTMKSKKTNVYDKMDINLQSLRHINFLQNGTFSVKFNSDLQAGSTPLQTAGSNSGIATIEFYMADKNLQETYTMKDKEIVIARKEPGNQGYSNYLLIDSSYVSNPHARIRFNDSSQKFQIASFSGNETRVNEKIIPRSEPTSPEWSDLHDASQVLLSSMVTLKFKNTQTI